ncbi:cytochrome P450 [Actinomadura sp. NEAU-AAG7]|uniref:cytochrome P450 n=1 Tax=Actinomadura sp. NEAU-AAG7 TaxID=2839640 RepID=UPI001BE3FAE7|nr:cytochrome P450 [Actinomadura sp. NEAU-AAG7]MBT2208946.1 cytochrome P450 [Actinomadura sp. NEAU-AAG7]
MRGNGITPSQIPGPSTEGDGAQAILDAGGLHTYQLGLHAEYGPVVRFPLPGAGLAVSIADPVLLEATAKINKRPEKLFEFLAPLQESGNLQTLPADEHGPWRRVMLSVLAGRPSHEAHFAHFTALATDLADAWQARAASGPASGGGTTPHTPRNGPASGGGTTPHTPRNCTVTSQKDLSELSLRMICRYALGSGLTPEESARVVAAFEAVLTEHLGRLYQPDAPDTSDEAEEGLAYLRATVDRVLAAHRESTGRSDMIAALAESGASPARIRDSVLMAMLAAHHTTGVAISWVLYTLSQHPDAAARVAAELDEVLGDRAAPDYADLRRLTYLDRVLRETMRLYPPGPYGAREATEDITVGDYEIPAGTTIFYPFWAVHMNPRYWPDPHVFDPDRFTPEASAGRPRLAYIPFGIGPRSCEGAALAMVEAELVLAVLLKRFEFRLTPGRPVTPTERFVLWAANDIHLDITLRE